MGIARIRLWPGPGFLGGSAVKNPSANKGDAVDMGLIPGLGRSPGGGNGNPLQYSCLENPMDRGALWDHRHFLKVGRCSSFPLNCLPSST